MRKENTGPSPMISLEIDPNDTSRQEERAQLDLFRSISIGKMIAVIGSGVTTTYGYDTWGEMLQKLLACLKRLNTEGAREYFDEFGCKYADEFFKSGSRNGGDEYNLTVYGSLLPHLTAQGKNEIYKEYKKMFGPRLLVHRESAAKTFPGLKLPECNGNYLPQDYSHLLFKLAELLDSLYEKTRDFIDYSASISKDSKVNKSEPYRINFDRNLTDPLDKIRSQLRVRRFATFNYDMEIESLLEDYDYPYGTLTEFHGESIEQTLQRVGSKTHDKNTAQSQSRLGSIARSISLSHQNSSELISLAAVPADDDEAVVHLHGAVNYPQDMVVSQRDYDATYINNHPQRNAFEDARKLMFGGNSVLYIGVGMSEEDVLRPLRYLATVVTERPIYALIPSLKSHESDVALAKKIKSAYRINAIPYGPGSDKMPSLAVRFGIQHPLADKPGAKFIPLHREAENIENYISSTLLQSNKINIDIMLDDKASPRLRQEIHYYYILRWLGDYIKQRNIVLNFETKEQLNKSYPCVQNLTSAFKSVVTSIALNHAIQIMAKTARAWRQEWKISSGDSLGRSSALSKIESLHNIDLKEPIPDDKEEAKEFISSIINNNESISVFRFPGGRGLSSISSMSKMIKKAEVNGEERFVSCQVINLNHIVAANSILPAIYRAIGEKNNGDNQNGTTHVFLINGTERLMDRSGTEVQNIAVLVFLRRLMNKLPEVGPNIKIVFLTRRKRTAQSFYEIFGIKTTKKQDHKKIDFKLNFDNERYKKIYELCNEYRWPYFVTRSLLDYANGYPEDKESVFNYLEDFLQSRIHSVDAKNRQSVFCGAVLDAFHAHAQRRFGQIDRIGLVIQHTALKWMFAVRIPINCRSILLLPEIKKIRDLYGSSLNKDSDFFDHFVLEQVRALHKLNFLLEIEKTTPSENTERTEDIDIRYILHSNVTMFLAHKRGLSLGWMDHREWNSATLCYAMMDGGPMLNKDDYTKSCEVYEAFLQSKDLRALNCAFAIVRGHLYAPNAMRAGLMYFEENEKRSVLDLHVGRLSRLRSAAIQFNRENTNCAKNFELFEIWITNEIGIIKFVQGDFHDSVMLFREALDFIKRQRDGTYNYKRDKDSPVVSVDADPAIVLRIRINLSMALIERAHFEQAKKLIDSVLAQLTQINSALADLGHDENFHGDLKKFEAIKSRKIHKLEAQLFRIPELMLLRALSYGCKAQIELLTADLDKARISIDEAFLDEMSNIDLVGVRGWLYGLSAQIASASGDEQTAATHWIKSLAAARGSLRPDLILSMEIAEIEFQIRRCKGNRAAVLSALAALTQLEKTAQTLGSHKARVGILLIRARALLFLQQTESAREAIIDSICLSLLNGMRLKRVSGLVLMVALMALRGEREAAKQLLHSIRLIAVRFRYIRAALDIDRLEREIDMEGSVSSWAGYLSDIASE